VRFPSTRDPGDAGWHIDGSYDVEGRWWVNVHSRGRGLLALFLFTDVAGDDAPTELNGKGARGGLGATNEPAAARRLVLCHQCGKENPG
jgi:hypothetical protein